MYRFHKVLVLLLILIMPVTSYSKGETQNEGDLSKLELAIGDLMADPYDIYPNDTQKRLDFMDDRRSRYKNIFNLLKKYADKDNYRAMSHLALMYQAGKGVKKDLNKAIAYHLVASNHSEHISMLQLASFYIKGKGIRRDYSKARELLEDLVEDDDARAYFNLSVIYRDGLGVDVDYNKAFEYAKKGCMADIKDSIFQLGQMCLFGYGTDTDYKKAMELFTSASKLRFDLANYYLAYMYAYGKGVPVDLIKARKLTTKYIAINRQKYLMKAYLFEQGYTYPNKPREYTVTTRNIYVLPTESQTHTKKVKNDKHPDAALFNYKDAAKRNAYCAENGLANLYLNQTEYRDVVKDEQTGMKYLKKSASKGCFDANVKLYYYYKEGKGNSKSLARKYDSDAQKLLITDKFEKATDYIYLTAYEYYRGYLNRKWLEEKEAKGNEKAKEVLKILNK